MADIRNTQEIFTDLFGNLTDLGARGVDGFVLARAVIRLLIQKGILNEEEILTTMREILEQEVEKQTDSPFVLETYKEMLERLKENKEEPKQE